MNTISSSCAALFALVLLSPVFCHSSDGLDLVVEHDLTEIEFIIDGELDVSWEAWIGVYLVNRGDKVLRIAVPIENEEVTEFGGLTSFYLNRDPHRRVDVNWESFAGIIELYPDEVFYLSRRSFRCESRDEAKKIVEQFRYSYAVHPDYAARFRVWGGRIEAGALSIAGQNNGVRK
ncbi:MAG: hypothetical protein CUN57_00215 [Phototrophicales bacterium]|nr:MAG: hypothetical protein CUN57_00215 [Phototrophicales bacterium]